MKKILSRTSLSLLVLLFSVGLILLLWRVFLMPQPILEPAYSSYAFDVIDQPAPVQLRVAFAKAIRDGRIKLEEFEELDFTMPDEPGFGNNIDYEVFNPNSRRAVISANDAIFPLVPEKVLEGATGRKNTKPFFNLVRVRNEEGYVFDTIVFVVPDILLSRCALPGRDVWGVEVVRLSKKIEFLNDGLRPIDLTDITQGGLIEKCLQTGKDRGHILLYIAKRTKTPVSEDWKPSIFNLK